jgi:hypothetical protein
MAAPVFDNFLFDLAGNLTGGFVTDSKTLLVGMLFLGFLLMAADKLFEVFQIKIASKNFEKAKGLLSSRDSYSAGTAEYDYYNTLYRQSLSRSVGISSKTGKTIIDTGSSEPEGYEVVTLSGKGKKGSWNSASLAGSGYTDFNASDDVPSYYADDPGPSDDDYSGSF